MSASNDILTLYNEFTNALTRFLRRMQLVQRAGAASQGHVLPSRSTLSATSMHIFWRWRSHSRSGRRCKMWGARTRTALVSTSV
jgi:hypothetical protein